MDLTPDQLVIIGLLASGLGALLKLLANWQGYKPTKAVLTTVVGVLSVVLAVVFNIPQLPVYTDLLPYIGEWLSLLSAYVGAATLIYNYLIDKLVDYAKAKFL
jgi:hypothetical protein